MESRARRRPLRIAGIRNVRDELYWQEIEPERGHYLFPPLYERYMEELRRAGIEPLVELTFANRAYDGGLTPYTDEGFAAYARYGLEVLRHYGSQIRAVEIWNEYNGSFCTGPASKNRAQSYARMAQAAYRALKKERPQIVVAGGVTAGVPLPYFERLFSIGALNSMDVVSIHPYRFNSPPEGIEDDVAALQSLIRRYNHGNPKPIWVTEIGWGTKPASASMDLAIDQGVQASFLVRAYTLLLSAGVERIYWYLFRDYGTFVTMGLVRDDKLHTPKKDYQAMKTLISELGNARFKRRESTRGDLYSILFEKDGGGEVRVIWSLQPRSVAIPRTCKVIGMLGGRLPSGVELRIAGDPIFVEGALSGLPAAGPRAAKVVADSVRDFSGTQDSNGWSYGTFVGSSSAFVPLKEFRTTDWKKEWCGQYPYLSISDREQHPSESPGGAVAAVRRRTIDRGGRFRIIARFRCGSQGDGVGVKVLLEGRELFSETIGGGRPVVSQFDSVRTVPPGGRIDFAVFPGPRGNADFDATEVTVTIAETP